MSNLRISLSGAVVWGIRLQSTENLYGWVTRDTVLLAKILLLCAVTKSMKLATVMSVSSQR